MTVPRRAPPGGRLPPRLPDGHPVPTDNPRTPSRPGGLAGLCPHPSPGGRPAFSKRGRVFPAPLPCRRAERGAGEPPAPPAPKGRAAEGRPRNPAQTTQPPLAAERACRQGGASLHPRPATLGMPIADRVITAAPRCPAPEGQKGAGAPPRPRRCCAAARPAPAALSPPPCPRRPVPAALSPPSPPLLPCPQEASRALRWFDLWGGGACRGGGAARPGGALVA
jgi:hypothetical protein